ncbi:hypothetical protein INR49_028906 [Caranx melampygus]|nr:hypothetical protein INR49_028906 [Caranx melampygus]
MQHCSSGSEKSKDSDCSLAVFDGHKSFLLIMRRRERANDGLEQRHGGMKIKVWKSGGTEKIAGVRKGDGFSLSDGFPGKP